MKDNFAVNPIGVNTVVSPASHTTLQIIANTSYSCSPH